MRESLTNCNGFEGPARDAALPCLEHPKRRSASVGACYTLVKILLGGG